MQLRPEEFVVEIGVENQEDDDGMEIEEQNDEEEAANNGQLLHDDSSSTPQELSSANSPQSLDVDTTKDEFQFGSALRFQSMEVNGHPVWVLDEGSLRKDIDHCNTCGAYALRQEFFKPHYCVEACYFSSPKLMEAQQQIDAPIKLFKQPALPSEPTPFKVGQMLEAIDPENQSLFCSVSISKVQGWRLQLHFDGFQDQFNFWVNSDSLDIFPTGWCVENGFFLQPPGDVESGSFTWETYLKDKNKEAAPQHFFQITKEHDVLDQDIVIVDTKLEAVDIRASNLIICVATVKKVMGHRFLVHFDSWDNIYDYWTDLSASTVYPVGYCEKSGIKLTPPNGYEGFTWEKYLSETKASPMPPHLFQPLPPVGFKRGMRIECVDTRNPQLIRPVIIQSTEDHMLSVRFEGWPENYDVRMNELSCDLHPVGYCETTGHFLEPVPKSSKVVCPNLCESKGNIKDASLLTHTSKSECPYLNEKERTERVVVLVPIDDGPSIAVRPPASLSPQPLLNTPTFTLTGDYANDSELPGSSRQECSSPPVKKIKKDDIFAKMMHLAQSVLKEDRPETFLFDRLLEEVSLKAVMEWNVDQTFDFIASIPNCIYLAQTLREQLVDGDSLLMLSKQDFKNMSQDIHWMKLHYALTVIRHRLPPIPKVFPVISPSPKENTLTDITIVT